MTKPITVQEFFEQYLEKGKLWPNGLTVQLKGGALKKVWCVMPRKSAWDSEFAASRPIIGDKLETYQVNGTSRSSSGNSSDDIIDIPGKLERDPVKLKQRWEAEANKRIGDEGEAVQTLFSELCVYYRDKLGLDEMSTRYIAGLAMSGGEAAKHALEKAGLSPCSADQLRRFIAQAATNDEGRI